MTWLEQNIDAYRIVSEILGELRRAIRSGLETVHGDTWYRDGLPEDVFDRLVASKEREKAIDWYEGQYQQIMDYAVFVDLVEILEHNAEHFPALTELAPNSALLQARFIELDVMRAKLGRARPISETELSFLGTFHLRFRKALAEMPTPEPAGDTETPTEQIQPEGAETSANPPPAAKEVEPPPETTPKPTTQVTPPPPKAAKVVKRPPKKVAKKDPAEAEEKKAPKRAPKRAVQSSSKPASVEQEEPAPEPEPPAGPAATSTPEEDESPLSAHAVAGPKKLAEALENNEHRIVLRELYREVTTIAEGVWTTDVTPAPLVWEQVTASDWYELNFSRLGLQALSVFYEVTGKVEDMTREGASKKELQEYLKETNFARTLLALRDMFQANQL